MGTQASTGSITRHRILLLAPWLILAAGIGLTVLLWQITHQQALDKAREGFEFMLSRVVASLDSRIDTNAQVLRGVVGLYASSNEVTRTEFRAFVASLLLEERYPGIQGVGFAKVIPPAELAEHVKAVRAEGFPEYRVRPEEPRDFYTAIVYLEPFDWRNQRAFGYDMYSEAVRRQAMERARDTGTAALSGRVTLLQETERDIQAGTLLYVPIYRYRASANSVAERRANLVGWAYSPLRMHDMVMSIIESEHPNLETRFSLAIYDGDAADPGKLLFATRGAAEIASDFEATRRIELAGQQWTIVARSVKGYGMRADIEKEQIILLAGLVISLLLSLLFAILSRSQLRIAGALEQVTRANAEISRNQQELQTIYDTSSVAIFIVDPAGIIQRANQRMAEMFACPLPALVGSEYVAHLHPSEREVGRQKMLALLASEIPSVNLERRYWREDQTEFWGHLTGIRMQDEHGRTIGLVGVIADISELKEKTRALEQHRDHLEELVAARTQELMTAKLTAEAASRAKDAFLANMSHELRTPLNAISGMTYLIQRDIAKGQVERQAGRLEKIDQAVRHLLEIISGILDLSKIESGQLQLDEVPVDIGQIINETIGLFAPQAEAKGLHLQFAAGSPLPCRLLGDPTRLKQALVNYVGNAIKFTPAGSITVRARALEQNAEGALLRFEVEDTGIGIEPAVLARLFTHFEQGDNSMTRKYGGSGLGLVITRHIAELMGGAAGADSTPGQGSTFWFTARLRCATASLPAFPADAPTRESAMAALRERFSDSHLLLVEDDPTNREVILGLLAEIWSDVEVVEDGRDAVTCVSCHPFDLILMDLRLPRMNGLEAARAIRQLPHGNSVPIVALTANAFSDDRERCYAAGMNDFIAKPVPPEALYATLLKWLAAGR